VRFRGVAFLLCAACASHDPAASETDAQAQPAGDAAAAPSPGQGEATGDAGNATDAASAGGPEGAAQDAAYDARCYAFGSFTQPSSCPPVPPPADSVPCDAAPSETCTYDDGAARSIFACSVVLDVGPRWTSGSFTYPRVCPAVVADAGAGDGGGASVVAAIDAASCHSASPGPCDCENLSPQDHVDYEVTMAVLHCGLDAGSVTVRLADGCAASLVVQGAGDAGAVAGCLAAQLASQSFACTPQIECGQAMGQ